MSDSQTTPPHKKNRRVKSDIPFFLGLFGFAGVYLVLILSLLVANASFIDAEAIREAFTSEATLGSLKLTFLTCTISAILSLFAAIPIAYSLSRFTFKGKTFVDTLFDIPIVLPPLVVGLSLLILFNRLPDPDNSLEKWLNQHGIAITFHVPAIILAQFTVAAAFAVRSMKNTFDQISSRTEDIALTLGCNRSQAFWKVTLPQAHKGIIAAGLLAWARALGEFGPILVFAGATRGRTEVLATSVFLEINIGNLAGAASISLVLITLAILTILTVRLAGDRR
ncbi:ABC transporter permease [Verrucomicrobiaceae bacterium N1E253]|uniref:ABC transporter permease n=1 Tax=Oceaniferula marina TaxID=2748318 RepID=A0A851G9I2_9BACT|nr:ABC transporter permease [Oceaniferula marina]NWK54368.1 ABC transporter permease [Oceaniferula marina]